MEKSFFHLENFSTLQFENYTKYLGTTVHVLTSRSRCCVCCCLEAGTKNQVMIICKAFGLRALLYKQRSLWGKTGGQRPMHPTTNEERTRALEPLQTAYSHCRTVYTLTHTYTDAHQYFFSPIDPWSPLYW